jgi:hypothetical protein
MRQRNLIHRRAHETTSHDRLGFGAALETTCEADAVDVTRAAGALTARRSYSYLL